MKRLLGHLQVLMQIHNVIIRIRKRLGNNNNKKTEASIFLISSMPLYLPQVVPDVGRLEKVPAWVCPCPQVPKAEFPQRLAVPLDMERSVR